MGRLRRERDAFTRNHKLKVCRVEPSRGEKIWANPGLGARKESEEKFLVRVLARGARRKTGSGAKRFFTSRLNLTALVNDAISCDGPFSQLCMSQD
jgi:hypothetical protein